MIDLKIKNIDVFYKDKIVKDATILIDKGIIVDVLTETEEEIYKLVNKFTKTPKDIEAREVIDGHGKLAMPGMINTHTHIAMGLLRNYADDLELMDWLQTAIWPAEEKLNDDCIEWGTQLGIAEMIRSGTTCFSDMYFFMDTTAKVVAKTGMRAVLSRGLAGVAPSANQALIENEALFNEWHGYDNNRIKVMLGPHAPYTCPDDYLKKVVALSQKIGAQIHMHISETKTEVDGVIAQSGKTPVAHLNDLGIFDNGCLAAHCVHVTEEDMDIMKAKNVRVAHNPQSNLKLASGIAPVTKMLEKGLIVGLGTDGSASNNNADMLEEVRLAALLHKGNTYDPKAIPALEALKMGTVYGAKALDYQNLGVIEKGYMADIVLYDVSGLHWMPRYNDIASLVYAANSSDTDTVIINGKVVMKDKELLTIDEERLKSEVARVQKVFK